MGDTLTASEPEDSTTVTPVIGDIDASEIQQQTFTSTSWLIYHITILMKEYLHALGKNYGRKHDPILDGERDEYPYVDV